MAFSIGYFGLVLVGFALLFMAPGLGTFFHTWGSEESDEYVKRQYKSLAHGLLVVGVACLILSVVVLLRHSF